MFPWKKESYTIGVLKTSEIMIDQNTYSVPYEVFKPQSDW